MYQYLTIQTLLLLSLYHVFNVEPFNLHYLTSIILLGGCYITLVKNFVVFARYDISGIPLSILNVVSHILPFIHVWSSKPINTTNIIVTYIYVLMYMLLFKPFKQIYFFHETEKNKFLFTLILYTVLFHICISRFSNGS